MKNLVSRFVKDESGATAIEYGLIAAGISVAIIAVVQGLGTKLNVDLHGGSERAELSRVRHFIAEGSGSVRSLFVFVRPRRPVRRLARIFDNCWQNPRRISRKSEVLS